MCYNAQLPAVIKLESLNSDLMCVTRVFNRWLKMLINYGRLEKCGIDDDFNVISNILKSKALTKKIKGVVRACRDYALSSDTNHKELIRALNRALKQMCKIQEDNETRIILQHRANQGMTERYRPLTKRLQRERIRKLDMELKYTNTLSDNGDTTRLVRRIVEKRAAQMVHRTTVRRNKETNQFRQSVRRATSFSLFNANFLEYDIAKRSHGTHWKVVHFNAKGKTMLKPKNGYNTFEEAKQACLRYASTHPNDPLQVSPYKCTHCGKWHFGHDRFAKTVEIVDSLVG